MSGDFLDNLTARVTEPDSFALQPRLASRFEEAAAVNDSPLMSEESDDGGDGIEVARILPSQPTETAEVPTANELRTNPIVLPQLTTDTTPIIKPERTEAAERDQSTQEDSNADFADRIDAITRQLDRLAGRIPAQSGSTQTLSVATAQVESIPASDANKPTVIEHHHQQHDHSEAKQLPPIKPNATEPIQRAPVLRGEHANLVRQLPANADVDAKGVVADERDGANPSSPLSVPRIAVESEPTHEPPVALADQSPVPQIVVESIKAAQAIEKTVNVTIGRIEVRAVPKTVPAQPPRRSAKASIMSLDDYLHRRAGGRR